MNTTEMQQRLQNIEEKWESDPDSMLTTYKERRERENQFIGALLYPLDYILDVDSIDENTKLNDITSLKVIREFEDDHVTCYELEMTVDTSAPRYTGEEVYTFCDMWAGSSHARMYYQSEISQDVRNNVLKPYLLRKIIDDCL